MSWVTVIVCIEVVCVLVHGSLVLTYVKTNTITSTSRSREYWFVASTPTTSTTITDGQRVSSLQTTTMSSPVQCASMCLTYKECFSYDFNSTNGICHMINDICRTSEQDIYKCGWVGVPATDCRAMGCCYNDEKDICFRSVPCKRPLNTPDDCGWPGITSEQCHAQVHGSLTVTYKKTKAFVHTDHVRDYSFVAAFSSYTDEERVSSLLHTSLSSPLECASMCLEYKECYTFEFNNTHGICHLINDPCRSSDEDRYNCGWVGVSASDCRAMGCCFNEERNLCFRSIPCKRPLNTPEDCGWPGITSQECHAKGCCENRYANTGGIVSGIKHCIYPQF